MPVNNAWRLFSQTKKKSSEMGPSAVCPQFWHFKRHRWCFRVDVKAPRIGDPAILLHLQQNSISGPRHLDRLLYVHILYIHRYLL